MKNNIYYDELKQYDFPDGEYLERVVDKLTPLIGLFLVKFSYLEHDLNLAIADIFGDDYHATGFVVIEKLTMANKIDMFNKMYANLEFCTDQKSKTVLNTIRDDISTLNTFRNNIVHANWQTLTKAGFVRSKIVVDNQDGLVKFKNVEMQPKIIRQMIRKIDKLLDHLYDYKEKVFNNLYA
jgi:hypothetical protein